MRGILGMGNPFCERHDVPVGLSGLGDTEARYANLLSSYNLQKVSAGVAQSGALAAPADVARRHRLTAPP
jgi:hypothetical protein